MFLGPNFQVVLDPIIIKAESSSHVTSNNIKCEAMNKARSTTVGHGRSLSFLSLLLLSFQEQLVIQIDFLRV